MADMIPVNSDGFGGLGSGFMGGLIGGALFGGGLCFPSEDHEEEE